MKAFHTIEKENIYTIMDTSKEGLTEENVIKRLQQYGKNELTSKQSVTLLKMIVSQLTDKMILILIAASILSFALGEWLEGSVILVIIVINALVSIIQEKKAANAIEVLKQMNAPHARVLRGNKEKIIESSLVIPGDIVFLEDGGIVPADIRLIETNNLKVDESSLTGESVPVLKESDVLLDINASMGDRINMVYASTIITYGTGMGVVTATGMETEVGKIAHMLDKQDDLDTPLKRKLEAVGTTLSIVGILISILIFIIGLLYHKPVVSLLMISVSLAISVIPEGLPATATIVMALGVQRMAKKNALVKKLPAVETLGSASVICSDKTGTLTQNKMTVTKGALYEQCIQETVIPATEITNRDLLLAAMLCNNASLDAEGHMLGDPTEGALLVLGKNHDLDPMQIEIKYPKLFEQPFDSVRKRMSTIHKIEDSYTIYTKGAAEEVLDVCTHIVVEGRKEILTEDIKRKIESVCLSMSKEALRVLAFAEKKVEELPKQDGEDTEKELTFIGLLGMIDPPRTEVMNAIKTCHSAGIKVIMITGDHKVTATTIAGSLGIYKESDQVIDGDEMTTISDDALSERVKNTTVFARVSPSDKLRIVHALKQNGEVVAMTGDGVNDSPALKEADIGIAMGITGTDVAKGAADMILLNDNFTTIEYAVREGRRVYRNIQKVIQFLLAGNISEVLTIFIAMVVGWDTPILAVHILLINLVTDTLPALALGVDPENKNSMQKKPIKTGSLFEKELLGNIIFHGIILSAISLIAYRIGLQTSYKMAVTMTFLTLSLSQIIHALNQHSHTMSIFSKEHPRNKYLYGSMAASMLILLLILGIPVLSNFFSIAHPDKVHWIWIGCLSLVPLIIVEIVKVVRRTNKKQKV